MIADLLLVHGGSRDADVWADVRVPLEASGHRVVCPSLPDAASSSLEEHVEVVCREADRHGLAGFAIVGHSYGGLVATVAGARMAERVALMVYLDSAYPRVGRSLFDLVREAGIDLERDFGVDPDPPFVTPLEFDVERWRSLPKVYVRALRSHFAQVGREAQRRVLAAADDEHWAYAEIDTGHNMMAEAPERTAELLGRLVDPAPPA